MTATLRELDVFADPANAYPGSLPAVAGEEKSSAARVLALQLGRSTLVTATLAAALDGAPTCGYRDADGLLVAFDSWRGAEPPADVSTALRALSERRLQGRPVGLIGVGADARCVSENIAFLRAEVRAFGGYPVGAGLWIDVADCSLRDGGMVSVDVTLAATLVRFGKRVRSLAWARRALRSH